MRVILLCTSQWLMYIHKQNFLNNLKIVGKVNQIVIKPYKHIHIYMTSTYCKNGRARVLSNESYFPL